MTTRKTLLALSLAGVFFVVAFGCAPTGVPADDAADDAAADAVDQIAPPRETFHKLRLAGATRGTGHRDTEPSLDLTYDDSIVDAAVFRTDHEDSRLEAITGETRMSSFMSCYQCSECAACRQASCPTGDCPPGVCPECATCTDLCSLPPGDTTAPHQIWVSVTDELRAACSKFSTDTYILNIQQLQGLPPNRDQPDDSWSVLMLTIDGPERLFRPCVDPDPTTTGPCQPTFAPDATEAHRAWMGGQALSSWQLPNGYPWTRQGYTYNWNPAAAPDIYGTSEFVIPAGTPITVEGVVSAYQYCFETGR